MAVCQIQRNSWIPVVFSTLLSTGIILSFVLAYTRDEVKAGFPHISNTAGQQPQSGIFCIFIFLAAFAAFLCMMVRYASVSEANVPPSRVVDIINKLSLLFGAVSLGGMMMIGAFPLSEPPNYMIRNEWRRISTQPHSISALILFGCVNVYCALHTVLTIVQRKREGTIICSLRIALFICTASSFIVMKIYGARHAALKNCKECVQPGGNHTDQFSTNATSFVEPKGVLTDFDRSAISELGLAVCLVVYFFTFSKEFHHISISVVTSHETVQTSFKPPHDRVLTHYV